MVSYLIDWLLNSNQLKFWNWSDLWKFYTENISYKTWAWNNCNNYQDCYMSLNLNHTVILQIIELPQLWHGGLPVHPFPALCLVLLLNLMKLFLV